LEKGDPRQVWAVVQGNWKLLKKPERFELYDMDHDPGEHRNQRGAHPELEKELEERLAAFEERATWDKGESSALEIDRETLEALRELGYVE
jgi:arylsulfatase A-like enzyme